MKRRIMFFAAVVGGMLAGSIGAGCGGGDSTGSGGTGSDVTPLQACLDGTNGYCEKLAMCWPSALAFDWGTVEECKLANPDYCAKAVTLAGTKPDASASEACTSAFRAASCEDAFNSLSALPACLAAGNGTLKPGTACSDNTQCETGYCANLTESKCGACAKEIALGGTGCKPDTAFCAGGSYCDVTANVCKKMPLPGASCTSDQVCAGNSFCIAGTCAGPLKLGANCDPNNDFCDPLANIFCDMTSMMCVKDDFKYGAAGDSCADKYCDGATYCDASNTCKARILDGSPCMVDSNGADPCAQGYACVKGACALGIPTCK